MKAAIVMGSDSDFPIMKPAIDLLKEFGVEVEVTVASAHRTPDRVRHFVHQARQSGADVFIAAAGMAAHLAGVIASYTTKPVIGVPISSEPFRGLDALLATVQMPSGVPVATMAVNGAKNAALFAIEIFSVGNPTVENKLIDYRAKMVEEIERKDHSVQEKINLLHCR